MLKNKLFRRLALFASLIMLLTSTVNTTFGLIVTQTQSLINTFVPSDNAASDVVISKAVQHPFGDEYVIPTNLGFDFKVDFGALYANTTISTTNGYMVADENGSVQISVKPGTPFAVEGIDAGTRVTVTEIEKEGSGFAVKDGVATMNGVVSENGSLNFEYTNLYTPAAVQPVNLYVVGTKILEGRDWQTGDTFSFNLEQQTAEDTWTSLGTKSVTYDAQNPNFNRFNFNDLVQALTFDKIGVYKFRMTEVAGNLANVDYDKSVNLFTVKVTDTDMDGKLEIGDVTATRHATATEAEGNYTVEVTFNNTFVPAVSDPDDITVNIGINKTVKNVGTQSIGPDGFEFVLENTAGGEKLSVKSDKEGKGVFALPFTAADAGKTFNYKLYEVNKGASGVTYDTTVYELSVAISLGSDNKLVSTVKIDGKEVESAVASFENTYKYDKPAPPPTTKDNSKILFWLVMMLVSGAAFVVLIILDKKYTRIKA